MPARLSRKKMGGHRPRSRGFRASRSDILFWVVVALLLLCALTGGSAREDVTALLVLRPLFVLGLGAILYLGRGQWDFAAVRTPLLLLLAMAAWMLLQLVPLPPGIWSALAGHRQFAQSASVAGLEIGWRPLTLTPSLTWNSLVSLLIPVTMLIGLAALSEKRRGDLLTVWIAIAVASILLGVAQMAGSNESALYTYRVTNRGFPVGLLANRNHQAIFLAALLPLLPAWVVLASTPNAVRLRTIVAAAVGLAFVAALMITGSRTGMVLGLLGIAAALAAAPIRFNPRRARWLRALLAVGPLALLAVFLLLGKSASFDRIFSAGSVESDHRVLYAPQVWRMIVDFFPNGSGFGSFDRLFRTYEQDSTLGPTYFNHAHNDLAELALTGGVIGLILLAVFLFWWGRRVFAVLPSASRRRAMKALGRASAVASAILLLASLTDYALRTPLLGAFFVTICVWLRQATPVRAENGASSSSTAGE